ncbi:hypothetical protein EMCLV149L [Equine molluscum contagiosum-like virus]|nr:hypothetical protein EMCLV149L [Equine molluscum contagiosum-like virus]
MQEYWIFASIHFFLDINLDIVAPQRPLGVGVAENECMLIMDILFSPTNHGWGSSFSDVIIARLARG